MFCSRMLTLRLQAMMFLVEIHVNDSELEARNSESFQGRILTQEHISLNIGQLNEMKTLLCSLLLIMTTYKLFK